MVYLKPLGGLCNRMRTIDGMVSICKNNNSDLTVLWVMDKSLNIDFESIFMPINNETITVKILNCPQGYPENYFKRSGNYLKRTVKNTVSNGLLNRGLKDTLKHIEKIGEGKIMTQEEFNLMYSSDSHRGINSVREMDALFISKIEKELNGFFKDEHPKYLTTCYRMHMLLDTYKLFKPTKMISEMVGKTVKKFGKNTIGMHIRRSDHQTATSFSSLDKFIKVIDENIKEEPSTSVFLCTDDGDTKSDLMKKYGDKILVNEVSSYDRNNSGAVIDAMVDLYCLSSTKKVYGSHHSSFSQVASDIGGVEEITVI
ncbi:MAG: hypothetical protein ABJN84_17075 [Flavobacteriaceae bacterium]